MIINVVEPHKAITNCEIVRIGVTGRALMAAIGTAGVAGLDRLLEARARQALAALLTYLRTELHTGATNGPFI